MFKPNPLPRHRLIPPDWFVAQFNAARPWGTPPRTALDPLVWDLWLAMSARPLPSPLAISAST